MAGLRHKVGLEMALRFGFGGVLALGVTDGSGYGEDCGAFGTVRRGREND